jgi:phosphatidylglycerophosphatase C
VAGVAAFDLDGTLTPADSFLHFLRRVTGVRALTGALGRLVPLAGTDMARRRDDMKAALVMRLLAGRAAAEIEEHGRAHGEAVARAVTAPMRDLLDRHGAAAHWRVVVSASLEVYVAPAAERLELEAALATRLEVDGQGLLTGRLLGPNCRGPEKARRLTEWMETVGLAPRSLPLWAYGDSAGDRELLALADHPVRVRRGRPEASSSSAGPRT